MRGGGVRGLKTNVFATTEKRGCARESERGRGKAKNSPKKCSWKIQIFAKTGIHGNFFVHGRKHCLQHHEAEHTLEDSTQTNSNTNCSSKVVLY